jgi:hypothetical protein
MPPRRSLKKSSQRRSEASRKKSCTKLVVPILWDDAPIGTYHIDCLLDELIAFGFKPNDRAKLIAAIRLEIYLAAKIAIIQYRNDKYRSPLGFQKTKRFFRDTTQIEKLIRRNQGLDILDIILATTGRGGIRAQSEELFAALNTAAEAIKKFQDNNRPRGRPGNRDPLTQQFIDDVFEYWCKHLSSGGKPDEDRLFVRFLSAAWRDVQFPTKDHKGQPWGTGWRIASESASEMGFAPLDSRIKTRNCITIGSFLDLRGQEKSRPNDCFCYWISPGCKFQSKFRGHPASFRPSVADGGGPKWKY